METGLCGELWESRKHSGLRLGNVREGFPEEERERQWARTRHRCYCVCVG